MFIGLSKTFLRFGGFRLGMGMRISKKNIGWAYLMFFVVWMFQLFWYCLVFTFWLMYAMFYFIFWLFKKVFKLSIPFIEKLMNKIAEECNKKEGNQA